MTRLPIPGQSPAQAISGSLCLRLLGHLQGIVYLGIYGLRVLRRS